MSKFLSSFVGRQMPDGVHWSVTEELRYQDDALGIIIVPISFVTDGGSIPPLAQGFINPYGKGLRAFVVHDWLYGTQRIGLSGPEISRDDADQCLRRALSECGENWLDDNVQFDAVRLCGEKAWDDDKASISTNLALRYQNFGYHPWVNDPWVNDPSVNDPSVNDPSVNDP